MTLAGLMGPTGLMGIDVGWPDRARQGMGQSPTTAHTTFPLDFSGV